MLDIYDQIHPLVCDGADYVYRSTEKTHIFRNEMEHTRTFHIKRWESGL